jgi:hypothetical protein
MIAKTVWTLSGKMIVSLVAAACIALAVQGSAEAESTRITLAEQENHPADGKLLADEYHTPLEGEACTITAFGRTIQVPARDTRNELAISIGGSFFTPKIGDDSGTPYGALYWKHYWGEQWRARAVIGIFVNEIDVVRSFGTFEALAHWENETIPFPTTEIIDGYDIKSTSIRSGTFSGWFGAGYRVPVAPFTPDNDLRLQLFYAPGYLYTGRTGSTGPLVKLPPSTFVHGFHFRVRYDSFLRNLMELPHAGWAGGLDLELMRRNRSEDHTFGGGTIFRGDKTRDYLKLSGYLMGAAGVPGLSERHRLIGFLNAGFAPSDTIDRFSAFRIGGGPFPTESDDLYRLMYPGALFNQFPVANYAIATLEYRLELLAFLYLHLRGTVAYAERPFYREQKLDFTRDQSGAFTLGVTSGFFWDSQIYTEYAFDAGILRNGKSGSSFLILWSKSL